MYNVVSFTLPVPAMSHGHRGGDGVSVVEVTPRSTHSLWAHPSVPAAMARIPRGFWEAKKHLSWLCAGNCTVYLGLRVSAQ